MVYEDEDFAQPQAAGQFSPKDYNGRLLLIYPTKLTEGVLTSFGANDAVSARIVVINEQAPTQSEEIDNAMLFSKVLVTTLTPDIGKRVLARLGQGTAKPGQSPAWILTPFTDADAKLAKEYLLGETSQPSTPAAKPTASTQKAQTSFPDVPADKAQLALALNAQGTDAALIATATGLTEEQLRSIEGFAF